MAMRLLVEGLDWAVNEARLTEVFAPFGDITEVRADGMNATTLLPAKMLTESLDGITPRGAERGLVRHSTAHHPMVTPRGSHRVQRLTARPRHGPTPAPHAE